MFQSSSVVRLGNAVETPALLVLVALLTKKFAIIEHMTLIYF